MGILRRFVTTPSYKYSTRRSISCRFFQIPIERLSSHLPSLIPRTSCNIVRALCYKVLVVGPHNLNCTKTANFVLLVDWLKLEPIYASPWERISCLSRLLISVRVREKFCQCRQRLMETRTVKLLKVMPNMSRQVKPTLIVEPKLREGDKDLEHRDWSIYAPHDRDAPYLISLLSIMTTVRTISNLFKFYTN